MDGAKFSLSKYICANKEERGGRYIYIYIYGHEAEKQILPSKDVGKTGRYNGFLCSPITATVFKVFFFPVFLPLTSVQTNPYHRTMQYFNTIFAPVGCEAA